MIDLNHKIATTSNDTNRVDLKSMNWEVEDGTYIAELAVVFPWKTITKDTKVDLRDNDGNLVKDEDGNRIKVDAPNLTWHHTDMIFKIEGTDDVVRGNISTHPDMIGSANRFLYSAGLFDVTLADLYKHVGAKVIIHVKSKMETYVDKLTGLDTDRKRIYVSYYSSLKDKDSLNL